MYYRTRLDKHHPLAHKSGRVLIHRAVLYDEIGSGSHPCHWCGEVMTWTTGGHLVPKALIADHVNADITDNRLENIVASCVPCNSGRADHSGQVNLGHMRSGRESLSRGPVSEIVDAPWIARRLSVRLGTVHQWRLRGIGFPEPAPPESIGVYVESPIWIWSEVEVWASASGRLTEPLPKLGRSEVG